MLDNALINDTICALATPAGGAIGIIRLSGPATFDILSHVFSRDLSHAKGNTIHYGNILDTPPAPFAPAPVLSASPESPLAPAPSVSAPLAPAPSAPAPVLSASPESPLIDEALVSIFRAPHSYTGEDSAEISCHGSRYILTSVLQLLMKHGARMARPGEYTQRAFLNGKLDLSQAEAVADLIASTSRTSHRIAISQLKGHFSSRLSQLRDKLLHLTSLLELELDFSDHEELEFADRSQLLSLAREIDDHITHLAHSFKTGQAIKNGIPVAIIGKTNAGKSTLLNQLLGEERAIVSDVHGTTRDTIEDSLDIQGILFRFIDTAGIRLTSDTVEQIGIQRTYQAIDRASIIIWLIDETPSPAELANVRSHLDDTKTLIVVRNKSDIASPSVPLSSLFAQSAIPIFHDDILSISAKYGTNISALKQLIYEAADIPEINENDTIISSTRHYESLMQAHTNLAHVISSLESGLSGDLVSEDLKLVLENLAEITGNTITPQDTLNNIFSHFCIGK